MLAIQNLRKCRPIPKRKEELHNSEENCVWCEEHCSKRDEADCWMHYFEVKYNEKEGDMNE